MKRAINAWSIPGNFNFEETFSMVSEAGFEGIELNIDGEDVSKHSLSMSTDKHALDKILALSEKYALPICSISTSQYGDLLGTKDMKKREKGKKLLEKQLVIANALRADGILVVPGGIGEENSIKTARENAFEILSSMKTTMEDSGIKVGLENVWNYFFASPIDMAQFIDDIDSPAVGAYFDVGNVEIFSYPEHWIEILGRRIVKVHVKDFQRAGWNAGNFVNLLEGSITWNKVVNALRIAGYDGYLTAELGAMEATPEYLCNITNEALKLIINMQ